MTSTSTTPDVDRAERTRGALQPPYAVILYNDDTHAMDYVVAALVKSVPELSTEDAARVMLEAHTTGRGIVIVCPLERAELYRDRIHTFGLGVTVEQG